MGVPRLMSTQPLPLNRVSLYEQIASRLLERIRSSSKPGDRLPSEAALSKELGVSAITLREALSVLAFRGVIERRHGSGTYVADPAASQWVAIVTNLDLSHPYVSYFHRRVAYHLRALLVAAGLRVRIYSGTAAGTPSLTDAADLPEAALRDLNLGFVRAVVYLPSTGWEVFRNAGVPMIGTNPSLPYSVSMRHEDLVPSGLEALADRGCKRVALLCWDGNATADSQWKEQLALYGLSSNPEWVKTRLDYSRTAAGWHGFHELWSALDEKPDGVIIDDDILFREVSLAILSERIDVPEKLKVFTAYNIGSRIVLPFPCLTFEVDPDQHARELASLCQLAISENPPKSKHARLPVQIVEHDAGT